MSISPLLRKAINTTRKESEPTTLHEWVGSVKAWLQAMREEEKRKSNEK
jgi:hypothetical protein